ncbi:protein HESO1-like [Oryza glaberrima]|uniref:Poly(A) RNA polymerase mitochondrial-like central palm domain-containing protein n=1 Tax=Oryza barthii TaxID=65489 RepID=A0A0D3EW68_9ORYZ|nr:protein HESO1-like [Oryza glaberrima]
MTEHINYDVVEQCVKNILSLIKPVEDDRRKRLSAIQELSNSIPKVAALRGAVFKPFGSFVSNLYSNSGDLDISVQLPNNSIISKKKKQYVLRELMRVLQNRGVAGYVQFIPFARVPVLQYVSNTFGISCDISVNNYPGRIKSKIFCWISSLDVRFGDMVLLIKEWAKAQNINDPKTGTLNSYSLCLLVLFHFQTCEPAILPPLKEIYEGNIEEEMTVYDEEHLDEVCSENLAKFQSKNKERRNESSLCHLLATFFHKFSSIGTLSGDVISTYTGQFKRIEENPSWMARSYSLFVEDPIERPDNAARAVGLKGLERIAGAFTAANRKFASLQHAKRNDLLEMLCTPAVGSKLGIRVSQEVMANSCTNTPRRNRHHGRPTEQVSARPSDNQNHRGAREFTVGRQVHNPPRARQSTGAYHALNSQHVIPALSQPAGIYQTVGPYQSNGHPQVYTRDVQTVGHQNYRHPMGHTTQLQTVEPYQSNNSQPQVHATSIQAPRQYQNYTRQRPARNYNHQVLHATATETTARNYNHQLLHAAATETTARNYNHQSLHATATETEGSYRNQQQRQHTSGRQTNRNAVNTRYVPVVGRPQNVACESRAQDSSGRGTWQQREPRAGSTYQNR